ncbi:hypothetical protein JR316_0006467 [Psilocybe cubensis]|uniref:Uncharacterized protein n=2 Tax=Psilocybe cubensis TaxID=181762 RepID=A0ACB8H2P3_PSICU|nr:hypothetical protein JR316_0006467 [Psilocybe cubensis]KAH9481937.1 hypothetical protein JR316_0006467 [Psilocybe cubensis]
MFSEGSVFEKDTFMSHLARSDTITKAISAAQEEALAVPLREGENDDDTIRGDPKIDTSIFNGFTDFELDLSCLSPPASPSASTSELPPSTPSPPSSPNLSRTISYASQLTITTKKSKKKASTPQLSSTSTAPAGSRGSWPIIKYAGRGTPIDRNRRLEWGGFSGDEVAEDGLLFSAVRSTSLDSAIRPSHRSLSPEWNHRSPLSSANSHSTHSDSHRTASTYEQPPALAPIQFEGLGPDKSEDWDSIMKTVLSSTEESPEPAEAAPEAQVKSESEGVTETTHEADLTAMSQTMSPEQMEQLNTVLEMDLDLNAALDLGLGQKGGMNWFDLGLLPTSTRGRESPSVYSSQAQSPEHSAPPSVHASEHRSTTSTKAESTLPPTTKSEPRRWWTKIMVRLRQVRTIVTIQKNRF